MDFRPTEAQQLLVASARDFLSRRCPIEAAPGGPAASPDLWPEMAELGWPGLLVPGDLGGSDGAVLDVMLLVEEMGRFGLRSPFVDSAVVATSLLVAAAPPARRRAVVPEMALGRRTCALALIEDSGELAPASIAARGDAGRALDGRKLFVKDAGRADDLVVVARGAGGVSLFHVERERRGVAVAPMPSMDGE